jgi:hypothetical protein
MGKDYVKLLVEMAKGLFGLRAKLAEADLAERNRTADLLDKVAGCIEDIAKLDLPNLRDNFFKKRQYEAFYEVRGYLEQKCPELSEYQRSLADVIGKQVSDIDRKRIQAWLDRSVSARGMMAAALDRAYEGRSTETKEMLGDASGRLRALSAMLRAGSSRGSSL